MAYQITEACQSCGTCEDVCPEGAIEKGEGKYQIDPEKCVDCGCCASACVELAIEPGGD